MKVSKKELVLRFLQNGHTLTRLRCFERFGLFELSCTIISLERSGIQIEKGRRRVKDRFGNDLTITTYKIKK